MSTIQSQITQMQNATSAMQQTKKETEGVSQDLNQDAFLMLMMEQLKNQDPTNPVDNQEFIAQQAQFTQVSELQKLNSSLTTNNQMLAASNQIMQASSLIGQNVTVVDPEDETKTISGKVTEANFGGNSANIVLGGKEYSLGSVIGIKESSSSI